MEEDNMNILYWDISKVFDTLSQNRLLGNIKNLRI